MSTCKYCLASKTTRKPFEKRIRAKAPLQVIHSNISGHISISIRYDTLYFITFIDEFTHYGHVYLIFHQLKALNCFKRYLNLVENQLDKKIKALRADQGREHLSRQFKDLCDENDINRQLTITGTP